MRGQRPSPSAPALCRLPGYSGRSGEGGGAGPPADGMWATRGY